jgi:hypothetical protein
MAGEANRSGGITFGNVGGDVNVKAGGDIVGGNKETSTVRATFADEEERRTFQAKIEELRELLRNFKTAAEASPHLSVEDKETIASEVLEHVKALKEVGDGTAAIPVGAPAPSELASSVESKLKRAGGLLESVDGLAKKSTGFAETVATFAAKFGPLILSVGHLFGLPR